MQEKTVLDQEDMRRTLVRISHEIVERTGGHDVAIVGIHRRGAVLAARLHELVDDLVDAGRPARRRRHLLLPRRRRLRRPDSQPVVHSSHLDFPVEDHTIVLVDDVLYTGRTVRAAIDALFDYGRPARVQLAVIADRGHRELPIRPDYVGKNLPTARDERVNVRVEELDGVDAVTIAHQEVEVTAVKRDLLSIADLSRDDIERILDRAESFAEVSGREIKKVPTLRGRTVINLFYEASTRTSSSFELAAKRLSRRPREHQVGRAPSVDKGESLKDTVQTLSAYDPAAIVIRHPHAGAAGLVARWTAASVINAGDGKHEHPTQALLDLYTLRRRARRPRRAEASGSSATSCTRASRARTSSASRGWACDVTVCGPPTLIPRDVESLGCKVRYSLDGIGDADVIYALRMQHERMTGSFVPVAARVRGAVPDRRPPAGPAPAADAPRARSTAASSCRPRSSTRPRR